MQTQTIAAGELNKRIELQVSTESVDAAGYGDVTPTWKRLDGVWAKIESGGGREFYRASQVYSTMTHLVTIRYRKGLTTKHRVKFGTRVFGIVGIENPDEAGVLLRLACFEAVDGVTA
jgi:SPP1 family predicted phage head-tail adaptor